MPRPKKTDVVAAVPAVVVTETGHQPYEVSEKSLFIAPLSIDYGREDLNDMARKINEIIDHLNGRH